MFASCFPVAFYDCSPIVLRRSDRANTAARPLAFLSAKRQYHSIIRSDMPTDLLEPLGGIDWFPLDDEARKADAKLHLTAWQLEQRQRGVGGLTRRKHALVYAAAQQTANEAA
jgi:hypothetical protein